jgi:DNA polymerase III subunit gamma/tau
MAYEVLARKYRPKQFDEVVGQDHVTRTLRNAVETDRVAHAYIFVGSRGIGKTTTARILAKALNCEKGPTAEPCDACDACREIAAGRSLDVIEIDGASNNSVDQVRELRENAQYAPARGPYKIYIIDEVHMLSHSAFNALLKTLEEPPPHVKFMFATTEPQKVPATILSRCQRFDLRRIETGELMAHLRRIAEAEGIEIDEPALLAVARGAEGGMRDAESALDQLTSFKGKSISEEDVLSVFGLVSQTALDALTEAVLRDDLGGILERVAELERDGRDLQRATMDLIAQFKDLLVVQTIPDGAAALGIPDVRREALRAQAGEADPNRLIRVIEILTETEGRVRTALSRRTLLETALIRCARAARTVSLDEIMRQLDALKLSLGGAPAAAPPAKKKTADAVRETAEPTAADRADEPPAAVGDDLKILVDGWHGLIDRIARSAPLLKSALLDARPAAVDGNRVTIAFDPEFAGDLENVDIPRNRLAIQTVLGKALGRDLRAEFLLAPTGMAGAAEAPAAAGPPDPPPAEGPTQSGRQDWYQDPSVRKVLNAFNGEIIEVRE